VEVHVVAAGLVQLHGPNNVVVFAVPRADVVEVRLERDFAAVDFAVGSQQAKRFVGRGLDGRGSIAGHLLRRWAGRAQVRYEVGHLRLGNVLFQPFRHQRLAGAFERFQLGSQEDLFLAVLLANGNARRRLAGQYAIVLPSVLGRGDVLEIASIDG